MTFETRLRTALEAPAPDDLWPGDVVEGMPDAGSPAAVLVAITDRPAPGLILTVRRGDMRTHAGQVAFPGGRIDRGEDAVAAALREAREEIAMPSDAVSVLGLADSYHTVTGFEVTPVVGLVQPDLDLAPNPAEVADWFEAPLDFVLDPANQHRMSAEFRGRTRHYYQINWEGRRIWGATAAMLVNLSKRLA